MTKLNTAIRRAIVRKVVDSVRLPREAAMDRTEHALALRATIARYGTDVFAVCQSLPEGWLNVAKEIRFLRYDNTPQPKYVPGRGRGTADAYSEPKYHLSLSEAAVLPNSFKAPWTVADFGTSYDEVYAFFEERARFYEELRALDLQVTATLASFKTVEDLAAGWPEGYVHFPHDMLAETGALPVPRLDDLNARIAALREAA
jgi:Nucleotide modification associated domain 5